MNRKILIPANAVNLITVINEALIDNFKQSTSAELNLPDLVRRAILVHYESGIVPATDSQDVLN